MKAAIHYELKWKLLKTETSIAIKDKEVFEDESPILARFLVFEAYQKLIRDVYLVTLDKPTDDIIDKQSREDFDDLVGYRSGSHVGYIGVYLVIDEPCEIYDEESKESSIIHEIGERLLIHGITCNFDEVDLNDNLYFEYYYYDHYGYDTGGFKRSIEFYDPDFDDFDKVDILDTPFDWIGYETRDWNIKEKESEPTEIESEPTEKESEPTQILSSVTPSGREATLKIVGKTDLSKFEKKRKEIQKDKDNFYIIDTNVFIECPYIISKIEKQYPIIIPTIVFQELEKKKLSEETKDNAQNAIRLIKINSHNRDKDIRLEDADTSNLPIDLDKKSPDNLVLSVALKYRGENQNPILLTSDNGLQILAKQYDITSLTLKEFLPSK